MANSFLKFIGYESSTSDKARTPQDVNTDIDHPGSELAIRIASYTFSDKIRFKMYERLASPIEAGVPIKTAISQLYQRAAFKSEMQAQSVVLKYLLYTINSGEPVSEGLRPFIPLNELLLLRAGEERGNLADAFYRSAKNIHSRDKIKKAIKAAMGKPLALSIGILTLVFFIGYFAAPQIDSILPMNQWAGEAAILAALSQFVTSIWFPIGLGFFIICFAILLWSQKRITGRIRNRLDKLPPYSLYRVLQGASWLTTYSSMLQSGRRVESILSELVVISERDGNKYLADRTYKIMEENAAGAENIGIAMERAGTQFPDSELIADLVMQSPLPNFDERIAVLSDRWVDNSVERVQSIAQIINGMAFVILGGVIIVIVLGIINLQQQINSSIGGF